MNEDHSEIVKQINQFRSNPAGMVPLLEERVSRYRCVKGRNFLFSSIYPKKAIKIVEKEPAEERIRQLISILENQTDPLPELKVLPKMDEVASRICQSIEKQALSEIRFKPETSQVLRNLLREDEVLHYPNDVYCLISLAFNEQR